MIIVSNSKINGRNERHMSYDEFKRQAYSDAGLDVGADDILMVNIHDMTADVYEDCKSSDQIQYFSLT